MPDLASLDLDARLQEMFRDDFSGDLLSISRAAAKKTFDSYTFNDAKTTTGAVFNLGYSILAKATSSRTKLPEIERLSSGLGAESLSKNDVKDLIASFISKGEWKASSSNTVFIGFLIKESYPQAELSGEVWENVIASKDAIKKLFPLSRDSAELTTGTEEEILSSTDACVDELGVGEPASEVGTRANTVAVAREFDAGDCDRYVVDELGAGEPVSEVGTRARANTVAVAKEFDADDYDRYVAGDALEEEETGLRDSLSRRSSDLDTVPLLPASPPPSSLVQENPPIRPSLRPFTGVKAPGSDIMLPPVGLAGLLDFPRPGQQTFGPTDLMFRRGIGASYLTGPMETSEAVQPRGESRDKPPPTTAFGLLAGFIKSLTTNNEEDPDEGDAAIKRHVFGLD